MRSRMDIGFDHLTTSTEPGLFRHTLVPAMRTVAFVVSSVAIAVTAVGASITSVGPMVVARQQHTATLLSDGTVLIAGGVDDPTVLHKEEIYNPQTRQFHAIGAMISLRFGHV